jgi:hypothetical protein
MGEAISSGPWTSAIPKPMTRHPTVLLIQFGRSECKNSKHNFIHIINLYLWFYSPTFSTNKTPRTTATGNLLDREKIHQKDNAHKGSSQCCPKKNRLLRIGCAKHPAKNVLEKTLCLVQRMKDPKK